jgi:hypothetical protein
MNRKHGKIVRSGRRAYKIENLLPDSFKKFPGRSHQGCEAGGGFYE